MKGQRARGVVSVAGESAEMADVHNGACACSATGSVVWHSPTEELSGSDGPPRRAMVNTDVVLVGHGALWGAFQTWTGNAQGQLHAAARHRPYLEQAHELLVQRRKIFRKIT